ncbi:MAG: manganese efflux pump MntP family protein [Roseburia sp.]
MNWIESLLIIAGISFDIFAAMECQGSLVAKINKKHLSIICILVSIWQMAALYIGSFCADLLWRDELIADENFAGQVLATLIFFCLGIRLFAKAIRNERINERREDNLGFKRFLRMSAMTSIYTVLTGVAFGLMGTSVPIILILIMCFTIAFVVMGMYTGYHFGFEHKTKAYVGGGILLWIAGIDTIVRYLC